MQNSKAAKKHSSKVSAKVSAAAVNSNVSKAAQSKSSAQHTAQPGIIASIMQQLTNAAVTNKPVTVAQILSTLQKQFPQRSASGMCITVRAQLSRLPQQRNFAINKTRAGRVVLYSAKVK